MTAYADLRARVAARGTPEAAVELAELEPLLGHRTAAVRAAIDAAAPALDAADADPRLRARLMLRLAAVGLAETDYEAAEQALAAASRYATASGAAALHELTRARGQRVLLRRGQRADAEAELVALALALPDLPDVDLADPAWRAVTAEVVVGAAECAIEAEPVDVDALGALARLVADVEADPRFIDLAFAGHQLLAAAALATGDAAAPHLRAVVQLARAHGSPVDEVQARITLAATLVAAGTPIALEEAQRTVQIARDRTLEHGLEDLRRAALLAQAGVLAASGRTAGAVDRTLELARDAHAQNDIPGYVASVGVMAEIYARSGDHVSAFRTVVEAHRALSAALATDTTPLFRPHLQRLRERIGPARLDKIAADVARADRLADEIAAEKA